MLLEEPDEPEDVESELVLGEADGAEDGLALEEESDEELDEEVEVFPQESLLDSDFPESLPESDFPASAALVSLLLFVAWDFAPDLA